MDPRPSPTEVLRCVAGEVCDDALEEALAALWADPNWTVFQHRLPNDVDLTLLYAPTGEHLILHLERRGERQPVTWRLL